MTSPVTLTEGAIVLRPLRYRDASAWREVRERNAAWLKPWEGTLPAEADRVAEMPGSFAQMVRRQRHEARARLAMPWVIEVEGTFAGQLTLGGISWGSLRGGYIGYWIDERWAGRGIVPMSVAMACDFAFGSLGMHRIEINIRPENAASLRVVEKLGLRQEGMSPQYLHIDGGWRDHVRFAVLANEVPGGLVARLRSSRHAE